MSKGQFKSGDEAKPAKTQHTSPCADCPFARTALRGWLGNLTAGEWLQAAHGEALIDCHTVSNQQCAGSAIYRANMGKLCRRNDVLRLKPNTKLVFATPTEFRDHHEN
jgi:hypothetical protein